MAKIKREPKRGKEANKMWQRRIETALHYSKKHWNGTATKERFYDLYRGAHFKAYKSLMKSKTNESPDDMMAINVTGGDILDLHSTLLRRFQRFTLKPERADAVAKAKLAEEALNQVWREYKMQRQASKAVLSHLIGGRGIVKVSYRLERAAFELPPKDGKIFYEDYVKYDAPYIKSVSDFLFLHDYDYNDLNDARWCIELFYRPIQDVILDPEYEESVRNDIKDHIVTPRSVRAFELSDLEFSKEMQEEGEREEDEYVDRIVLAEIWDKKFDSRAVYALDVEEPLVPQSENPFSYLEGFPYEALDYIPNPNEPFAIGYPMWIENHQHELNLLRSSQVRYRRRHMSASVEVDKNLDPREVKKYLEGEDVAIKSTRPGSGIKAVDQPPFNQHALVTEASIKTDMRDITGIDALRRGSPLADRTTAYEVAQRVNILSQKLGGRIEEVDLWLGCIGAKILKHMKENFGVNRWVSVLGPEGYMVQEYNKNDLAGDYSVSVRVIADPVEDKTVSRKQALELFGAVHSPIVAQSLLQEGFKMKTSKMLDWVFEKFDVQEFPLFLEPLTPQAVAALAAQGVQSQQQPPAPSEPEKGTIQESEQEREMQSLISNLSPGLFDEILGGSQ